VVDVAIVGDTDPVDVLGRDWMQSAFTGPTRAARITAIAGANRQILARTGPLFAVAQEAAAVEPVVREFWQQGREQSRQGQRAVWTKLAADGLLDPGADLEWIIDTGSVLCAAETYLLVTRMMGWDIDTYERWLVDSLTRLVEASTRTPG
jgi:hypothetical protein